MGHRPWSPARLARAGERASPPLAARMTGAVDPAFNIDDVHRDVLGEVFDENGLGGSAEDRRAITERWHQPDAWPDFAAALRRLRRHRICV
jgi:hypothetical protein